MDQTGTTPPIQKGAKTNNGEGAYSALAGASPLKAAIPKWHFLSF